MRPPPLLGAGLHLRRCRAPLTAPASSPFAACRAGIRLRRCRARERWIRCRRRLPVPEGACGALPGAAASDVDRGGRSTGEEERGVLLLLRQQVRAQIPSQQRAYFLHLASSVHREAARGGRRAAAQETAAERRHARPDDDEDVHPPGQGLRRGAVAKRGGARIEEVAGLKHMRTLMEEWPKCFGGC
uniref:Uncharacterized protein n=1 Tax=Oryza nivara TaxID=4536 RepID=A0A0E0IQM2_ORYNI